MTKCDKTLSDNILAVWMGVMAVYLTSYYLNHLGYWEAYPHLVGITHPFPLLFGRERFFKNNKRTLDYNIRLNFTGGERYSPVLE